jgi:hypothetical protein
MDTSLTQHFFSGAPLPLPIHLWDDPPTLPACTLSSLVTDKIHLALLWTSNSSAPGPSGLSYKLIKWAFVVAPQCFTDLFQGCLTWSVHPWHHATVVPLPKPGKADYFSPKSYHSILLLECCGKLLECIVSQCLMDDMNANNIFPPSQFRSQRLPLCHRCSPLCGSHCMHDNVHWPVSLPSSL